MAHPHQRSAITNGRRLHACVDGRGRNARRFKDLVESFAADFGGMDGLREADRALVRNAATLTLRAEQLQAATVRGEPVNPDEMIRLNSESRRTLAHIKAKKPAEKPRSLLDYHAGRAGQAA